jgi:chemotaxis protein histidine kinase CheA
MKRIFLAWVPIGHSIYAEIENRIPSFNRQSADFHWLIQSLSLLLEAAEIFEMPHFAKQVQDTLASFHHANTSHYPLSHLNSDIAAMKDAFHEVTERYRKLAGPNAPSVRVQDFFTPLELGLAHFAAEKTKELHPLLFKGGSIEVPSEQYSSLLASLIHVYYYLIDQSLESTEDRVRSGKKPGGTITTYFGKRTNTLGRTELKIVIQDDGLGFDPLNFSGIQSLGPRIQVPHSTIEKLGGTLEVLAKLGKGTFIHVSIPWLDTPLLPQIESPGSLD